MRGKAAASEGFGREESGVQRSAAWDLIFFGDFQVLCVGERAGREYAGLHRAQVFLQGRKRGFAHPTRSFKVLPNVSRIPLDLQFFKKYYFFNK